MLRGLTYLFHVLGQLFWFFVLSFVLFWAATAFNLPWWLIVGLVLVVALEGVKYVSDQ